MRSSELRFAVLQMVQGDMPYCDIVQSFGGTGGWFDALYRVVLTERYEASVVVGAIKMSGSGWAGHLVWNPCYWSLSGFGQDVGRAV